MIKILLIIAAFFICVTIAIWIIKILFSILGIMLTFVVVLLSLFLIFILKLPLVILILPIIIFIVLSKNKLKGDSDVNKNDAYSSKK